MQDLSRRYMEICARDDIMSIKRAAHGTFLLVGLIASLVKY